jgi:hypothetical protein
MEKIKCTNCSTENLINSKYCSGCGFELPKKTITTTATEPVFQQIPQSKAITKKAIAAIAGMITFSLAYYGVQQLFFSKPGYDKEMMHIASELNKTCPIMIDAETRLDNSIALPPNTFQYNYTLVNIDKESVDTTIAKNTLEPTIINFVKTNPQMQYARDHKTTINYYYKDKNGMYLFIVSVPPKKYE